MSILQFGEHCVNTSLLPEGAEVIGFCYQKDNRWIRQAHKEQNKEGKGEQQQIAFWPLVGKKRVILWIPQSA